MKDLTPRQAEVLEAIRSLIHEKGYPPTLREICERMGFRSTNAASCHLAALERKGAIRSGETWTARNIIVVQNDEPARPRAVVPRCLGGTFFGLVPGPTGMRVGTPGVRIDANGRARGEVAA